MYYIILYTDTNSQETSPPSNEEPISIADLKKKKKKRNEPIKKKR